MPEENAGAAYRQLVTEQLSEERSRKASIEARGITVITTSSALATLLFALTAGLTSATTFKLPGNAKLPLVLALAAFGLAASLGIATNIPFRYREPTPTGLQALASKQYWDAPAEIGELRVAEAQIKILAAARSANGWKVIILLAGMLFELLAVTFLAWAVTVIIYTH